MKTLHLRFNPRINRIKMYLGTTILFSVLVLLLVGPSNIAAKKRKPDKST